MEFVIGIVGLIISIYSIFYAIKANRDRERLEYLIKLRLEDICNNLKDGIKDTSNAYIHVEKMRKYLTGLKPTEELKNLLDNATWAQQDVTSAERMLIRLQEEVKSFNLAINKDKIVKELESVENKTLE